MKDECLKKNKENQVEEVEVEVEVKNEGLCKPPGLHFCGNNGSHMSNF